MRLQAHRLMSIQVCMMTGMNLTNPPDRWDVVVFRSGTSVINLVLYIKVSVLHCS